jgi:hypothetical protein
VGRLRVYSDIEENPLLRRAGQLLMRRGNVRERIRGQPADKLAMGTKPLPVGLDLDVEGVHLGYIE